MMNHELLTRLFVQFFHSAIGNRSDLVSLLLAMTGEISHIHPDAFSEIVHNVHVEIGIGVLVRMRGGVCGRVSRVGVRVRFRVVS